jgi:anti-sigma B factor antagonist
VPVERRPRVFLHGSARSRLARFEPPDVMMGRAGFPQQGKVRRSMASFEAVAATEPGRVTVSLSGDCDLSARDRLTTALLEAVERAATVFVDVAHVGFLDSTGVHALVTAHHAAQARGGRLYVTGAVGSVAAVLELTGLDALLRAPADPKTGTKAHEGRHA